MTQVDSDREEFYREARQDLTGPMAGIRVLEIATTIAGPRIGGIFADYGADVIRVENRRTPDIARLLPPTMPGTDPPDGHMNAFCNKNKRSLHIDIRKPEGRDIFMQLAARSDVLVENFKKGTMAGWGCGYEDVKKVKPDIVYVSVTGFGQFGPFSNRPGYDPAAQAHSGIMWMNAHDDKDIPLRVPFFLADELGGLHGALGAMAALSHRARTGEGQHVDISLLDAVMDSNTGLTAMAGAGLPTPRWGNTISFATPAGVYACKEGHVFAGVLLDSHWRVLAGVIGCAEWANDPHYATFPARLKRRDEVEQRMQAWCANQTRAEVIAACEAIGVTAAPVNTPEEAVNEPHLQAREVLGAVMHPCGTEVRLNNPAPKFSRTPAKNRSYAPLVGQHTEEILDELGIPESERQRLRDLEAL